MKTALETSDAPTAARIPDAGGRRGLLRRAAASPAARRHAFGLVDQAVVSGTSFLTSVLVGRWAGESELGLYALGVTILVLAASTLDSLVSVPYTVFASRKSGLRRALYAGSALALGLLIAAVAAAIVALAALGMGRGYGPVPWVVAAVIPAYLLREFARHYEFAELRMQAALGLDATVVALQLGLLAGLGLGGRVNGATALAAVGLAAGLPSLSWLALRRRSFVVHRRSVARHARTDWRFARWVSASQVASIVNAYAALWLLALLLDSRATGAYAAAMTLIGAANPLVLGLTNVLLPSAAKAFAEEGTEGLGRVIRRATGLLVGSTAAICGGVAVLGGPLLGWLYGFEDPGLGRLVAILGAAAVVAASDLAAGSGLRVLGRPDRNFATGLAGAVVALGASAALIPRWGLSGAAMGLLAGNLAGSAGRWFFYLRVIRASTPGRRPSGRASRRP